jgi:hypothetical protein
LESQRVHEIEAPIVTTSPPSPAKIPFKNVDPQSAPAFGVMQVTGSVVENGVTFLTCKQVGSTFSSEFAVNGPSAVRSGEKGICFRQGDLQVAYDSGSPQPGDGWGARAGQWTLSKGYPSIVSVHGVQNAANHILFGKVSQLPTVLGVSASDLAPLNGSGLPGSGSVTVWVWNGTDFVVSSPAMTFTGYNYAGVPLRAGQLAEFVEADGLLTHRAPENFIYSATAGADVADGASGNFTLSDARVVSAQNISGSTIHSGDSAGVFEDLNLKSYFALKAGSGASLVRFELTADLVYGTNPGGTNALIVAYASGSYAAGGSAITVYDFTRFSGYGSFSGKYDASVTPAGYQGWAILKPDSTRYEVVWMEQKAQLISFRLLTRLLSSNASSASAVVLQFWNGRDPDPSSSGVTVYNRGTDYSGIYKYSGDANAVGYAAWNEKLGLYQIIALEGDGRRWQLWKNTDSTTCPAYGCLIGGGITNDANSHSNSRVLMNGAQPSTTFSHGFFINGDTAVPAGSVGLCSTTESPVEAALDTSGAANDQIWGPAPGSWNLKKGFPGCRIIATTASSTQALVVQETICQLLVKVTATGGLANGSATGTSASSNYKIYTGGTAGSESDSGYTTVPAAWNRCGYVIQLGAWCRLAKLNTTWEIVPIGYGGKARYVSGTLNGSLTSGTVNVSTDGVAPSSPITMVNTESAFTYVSNVKYLSLYDPVNDNYRLIWIAC